MTTGEVTLPQPILFVLWTLMAQHHEAYVVGGAVRDLFMNQDIHDWDFTTSATPHEIQKIFPGAYYDNAFGTVGIPYLTLIEQIPKAHWQLDPHLIQDGTFLNQILEITTFRTEHGYSDKRRPDQVLWGTSLTEDLARRDFTINAMAIAVETDFGGMLPFAMKQAEIKVPVKLTDPYGGEADLKKELIRAVREPGERFQEDALRMMRAIRLGAVLGFAIEEQTLKAINEQAQLITQVSWERIRDELLKILSSPYPADGISLLFNAGLLTYIMPELITTRGVKQAGHHIYDVWTHSIYALKECPSSDPIVRLATLLHDIGKPKTYREQGPRGITFYGHEVVGARIVRDIGRRLRLPTKEIDRLFILVRWHMFVYQPEMTDAAIRRFIRRVGLQSINDMILLRVGDRKGGGSQATSWRLRELQERIGAQLYEPLNLKDLKVDGSDVMRELNLPPGPKVGQILNQLFEEVIEDSSKNTPEYLLERMKQL